MSDEQDCIARLESAGADELAAMLRRPTLLEDKVLRSRLGDELYQRLRSLALRRSVSRSTRKPLGNVVVIHCFMGSNLSTIDRDGHSEHVWVNALRLMDGQFARLRLSQDGRTQYSADYDVSVTGMMKRQYGELLLALAENWNVRAFAYDWRKDVRLAATQLEAHINQWFDDDAPIHIVAHGEGGMVARSFIQHSPERWERMLDPDGGRRGGRLLMLGTSNHGSFVIPQVMAGLSHLVSEMDLLDQRHDRAGLLNIVNSFVGLYQMLPSPLGRPELEPLYHAETYQALSLPISQSHLDLARRQHQELAEIVDPQRMLLVLGDNKLTIGSLSDPPRLNHADAYSLTMRGDGYVTHDLCLLTGVDGRSVPTFYLEELHGNLVTNDRVLKALDDLLEIGQTTLLAREPSAASDQDADQVSSRLNRARLAELQAADVKRIETLIGRMRSRDVRSNGGAYVADEQRNVEGFLTRDILCYQEQPPSVQQAPLAFKTTVEIGLIHGSIAEVQRLLAADEPPIDVIAIGQYKGVRPYSTMRALDQTLSQSTADAAGPPANLLAQYIERGIIRGELGQPFFLPDPRPVAPGEASGRIITIAGMGLPGRFGVPELTVLARELCWALGRLGKRHLATVLIGAGNGNLSVREAVPAWIRGIRMAVVGSRDDELHHVRRITFVEVDPRKIVEIDRVIGEERADLEAENRLEIRYTPLTAAQIEVLQQAEEQWVLNEWRRARALQRRGAEEDAAPTRVTLSFEDGTYRFGAITETASIPEREIPLDRQLVLDANDELAAEWALDQQRDRGQFLAGLLVPNDLREQIFTPAPLVMVLDATTARIHWEMVAQVDPSALVAAGGERDASGALSDDQTAFPKESFLGTSRGFTRQLRSTLAPPDGPPPSRRLLRVLVIADPAADAHLPGAEEEGAAVADLFETFNATYAHSANRVEVVRLFGPREATRTKVLRYLMTRSFDVLHFAGHCTYDRENPSASGWIFTGNQRLTAHEMNRIDRVPSFVFSNACESGITPDRSEERTAALAPTFAEAFFARGVTNFVCTAWPIADIAAREFALTLYSGLLGLESDPARPGRYRAATPEPMHLAMREARCKIATTIDGARTWGAYQHYGNPYFRFFDPQLLRDETELEEALRRRAPAEPTPPPTLDPAT